MIDPATREIIGWFSCSACELDVLKYILLSLAEPHDSPKLSSISLELDIISKSITDCARAGLTEQNRQQMCFKLIEDYQAWRMTGDFAIRSRMLPKIFALLELSETRSIDLMNNLSNQSAIQRSALREIVYRRLKGLSDFIRNDLSTVSLITHRDNKISQLESEIEQIKTLLTQKSQHLEESLKVRDNMFDKFEEEKRTLAEEHKKTEERSREQMRVMRHQLKAYKSELARYQSALTNKVNMPMFDDGSDGQMELRKRIERIHQELEDFTKVKGSGVRINEEAAERLLAQYQSRLDFQNKVVLSAALQRLTVKKVFAFVDSLYKQRVDDIEFDERDEREEMDISRDERHLEAMIVQELERMLALTQRFSQTREGNDSVSLVVSTILRKQVYTSLGHRAFEKTKSKHRAISDLIIELLDAIAEYRVILDDTKKRECTRIAMQVILDLIHLRFHLKAQEPEPELKWFESGKRVNLDVMDGTCMVENTHFEVDFCYFPAIGLHLTDEKMRVIFSKAQVVAKERERRGSSKIIKRQMSGDRIEY
ncbi:10906_t:CDS:2 [Paraglomus brasilianum]|uniref:10906_t:CDS:1 n=1 Tax=Paraglomus brasilianum TaxID=144538 RepID=A0A9N9FLW3_9GLOM|nr:10906_t:CDS:2 [Paraglomus brasilianum]